ncbi:MAG: nicotinate (nicotinamide) nucleotide adenylyltransferase [Oligoflexales bacterium]
MPLPNGYQNPDLVIYGGSFDPPHLGHEYCIKTCLDFFPETKILVVPANAPVSIAKALKPATANFNKRLEMCRLAFENEHELRVSVSSIEAEIDPPNFTLKTLKILKQKLPQARLCFLMGEDQWEKFSEWNEPLEILQLTSVFVVRREPGASGLKEKIKSVCKDLGLEHVGQKHENVVTIPSCNTFVCYRDIKPILLASSDLRTSIADQGKISRDEVSEEIKSYIFSHGLYH